MPYDLDMKCSSNVSWAGFPSLWTFKLTSFASSASYSLPKAATYIGHKHTFKNALHMVHMAQIVKGLRRHGCRQCAVVICCSLDILGSSGPQLASHILLTGQRAQSDRSLADLGGFRTRCKQAEKQHLAFRSCFQCLSRKRCSPKVLLQISIVEKGVVAAKADRNLPPGPMPHHALTVLIGQFRWFCRINM